MSSEAMKLALGALEQIKRLTGARWALENNYAGHLEAITALRQALANEALDKKAENARELVLDYEPATYTFKPTSAPVFAFDTKPNYNMTFHNQDGKQVGALDFNGPEMTFTGDADESAKLFFDLIARSFKARLEQERADERRVCEQICIDMYLSADMNTGEAAMAIAARGNT